MSQLPFAASQRFVRAADFVLKARPAKAMVVEHREASMTGSAHTLAILEVFSEPRTLGEALSTLRPKLAITGAQDWMDITAEIVNLARLGVLFDPQVPRPALKYPASGFARSEEHLRMLDDRTRTGRFLEAIRRNIRPGDVVLDIGTGSGILAIAAAQAGAARVYAVEATGIADLAEAMFVANGVQDRVTLIRGLSTEIELPERADVLLCELIGNDPLDERIQQVCRDAVKRLLKPSARMVPSRLELWALPMSLPDTLRERFLATEVTLNRWSEWYAMEFSPFGDYSRREPQYAWIHAQDARKWTPLAEPVLLADLDLRNQPSTFDGANAVGVFTSNGALDGVLLYFEADLASGLKLSTHPERAGDDNCWKSMFWLLDPRRKVHAGRSFRIVHTARRNGDVKRLSLVDE